MKLQNRDISDNEIDTSQNLLFTTHELNIFDNIDQGGRNYDNDFFDLHDCKDKLNNKIIPLDYFNKSKENGIKSINTNNSIFDMPLETLLDRVRRERDNNYKDLPYKRIINKLDNETKDPITKIDKGLPIFVNWFKLYKNKKQI